MGLEGYIDVIDKVPQKLSIVISQPASQQIPYLSKIKSTGQDHKRYCLFVLSCRLTREIPLSTPIPLKVPGRHGGKMKNGTSKICDTIVSHSSVLRLSSSAGVSLE